MGSKRLTSTVSRSSFTVKPDVWLINARVPDGAWMLGRPTAFDLRSSSNRLSLRHGTWIGDLETAQNFVRGVLQPGVRLVQLARSLARQLAQLIAVGHVRECPEN